MSSLHSGYLVPVYPFQPLVPGVLGVKTTSGNESICFPICGDGTPTKR